MTIDDKLTLCIAIIGVSVVLQVLVLAGILFALRKLQARMEAFADKLEDTSSVMQARLLPMLEDAKALQHDLKEFVGATRPKIETLVQNLHHISDTARSSVERIDATVNDAVDRIRLQVIRGDEMVTRTLDRIEETSDKVQHTVMSPVRQMSGIVQAISTGVGTYFNQQRRRRNGGPSDEMFI